MLGNERRCLFLDELIADGEFYTTSTPNDRGWFKQWPRVSRFRILHDMLLDKGLTVTPDDYYHKFTHVTDKYRSQICGSIWLVFFLMISISYFKGTPMVQGSKDIQSRPRRLLH